MTAVGPHHDPLPFLARRSSFPPPLFYPNSNFVSRSDSTSVSSVFPYLHPLSLSSIFITFNRAPVPLVTIKRVSSSYCFLSLDYFGFFLGGLCPSSSSVGFLFWLANSVNPLSIKNVPVVPFSTSPLFRLSDSPSFTLCRAWSQSDMLVRSPFTHFRGHSPLGATPSPTACPFEVPTVAPSHISFPTFEVPYSGARAPFPAFAASHDLPSMVSLYTLLPLSQARSLSISVYGPSFFFFPSLVFPSDFDFPWFVLPPHWHSHCQIPSSPVIPRISFFPKGFPLPANGRCSLALNGGFLERSRPLFCSLSGPALDPRINKKLFAASFNFFSSPPFGMVGPPCLPFGLVQGKSPSTVFFLTGESPYGPPSEDNLISNRLFFLSVLPLWAPPITSPTKTETLHKIV